MIHLIRTRAACVVCAAAIIALSGCGESSPTPSDGQAQADKIVADAKVEAEKIKDEAAEQASADATEVAEREAEPEEDVADSSALPDLVGKGLQYAQDASQEAGFYALTSHDAAGRGREQVLDRNWKVCTQTPAAGSKNSSATVDFGAVKIEEDCPSEDQGTAEVAEVGDRMPSFAGKSAAIAEEALPGASITFDDATGGGRSVIIASNWKVCSQRPAAGKPYSGVPVTLTVVKYGEGC